MKLRMVGCSHHHSTVAVRERLAFTPDKAAAALTAWRERYPATEALLLSTCNRVEFYAASDFGDLPPCPRLLVRHLADAHELPIDEVHRGLVTLRDEEVVEHLFRVAASLDSMVLGEPQIVAQVKEAYELASGLGVTGPLINSCFQSALRVAKRVTGETSLHRHRVSIPSIAICDFAASIYERFDDKSVLVIGAGDMAEETLRYLVDRGAKHLVIVNRDPLRGEQLARRWNGRSAAWSERYAELVKADLVIGATGAPQPIVTVDDFRRQVIPARQQRPMFLLDLAIPRDFAPEIGDELGVYLYSIDDLSKACDRNRREREKELPAANQIIFEERDKFFVEARHRLSAPIIARLRDGLEAPKQAELARLFNKIPELDERQREEIQRFADRLVGKMLHPPMESLRDESRQGSPHNLLAALSRLFQLKE